MLEPIAYFLTHPLGLTVIGWAAFGAFISAGWLDGRHGSWSRKRVILTAALPTPLIFLLGTAALLLLGPWDDSLIVAVLITVGMLATIFSLLVGLFAAWLSTAGFRR